MKRKAQCCRCQKKVALKSKRLRELTVGYGSYYCKACREKLVGLECEHCGNNFWSDKVFKRFCSRSCASLGSRTEQTRLAQVRGGKARAEVWNATRPDKRVQVTKKCPHCGHKFKTLTGCKSPTFCSRSCASAGSVTKYRRRQQSLSGKKHKGNLDTAAGLLVREDWKYKEIRKELKKRDRKFKFEFKVGKYVFDLALLDSDTLVEFDGAYHKSPSQKKADRQKDKAALVKGFKVVRCVTNNDSVIPESAIAGL